jgi:hypothetical protein
VGLLSSTATTTSHLRLLLNDRSGRTILTTAHLASHLLEELACLLAGHELELVATTTSHGGGVSGRTIEGDESFRSRSRHSVLYYLEEKFLRVKLKIFETMNFFTQNKTYIRVLQ